MRAFLTLWWFLGLVTRTGGALGAGIAVYLIAVAVVEVGDFWDAEII